LRRVWKRSGDSDNQVYCLSIHRRDTRYTTVSLCFTMIGVLMERYILHIFVLNWVLVIADAAMGYHVAPLLVGMREEPDPEAVDRGAQSIRRLLAFVVALYMFFNCLAYFRGNVLLLLLVSGIIMLDIVFQLMLKWRRRRFR